MNSLWLDKYSPKNLSEIIGHSDAIIKIKKWLNNFSSEPNINNGGLGSSIIISGIHGIGKSITIKMILEELNYNIVNMTSSNIKDSKTLNKIIINSGGSNIENIISNKKSALVIDDTENITLSTEKNMLLDLYKENENKKMMPIIFLTNEQHSKLISDIKKTCYEIKFIVPSVDEFITYIKNICKLENINIDNEKVYINIIKFSQFDIRKLLFILQDIKFTYGTELIDINKCKILFQSSQKKDKDIGLFDGTRELLENYKSIDNCLNLYETEKVLLPLMIFENYPRNILSRNYIHGDKFYECASNICNSISMGDVIETNIYTDQNWYLQSLHGFYTCCETTYELSKYPIKNNNYDIMFSSDLNKTSIKNINKKNISIIQNKINKNINDILFLNKLVSKLINKEEYVKIKRILKQYKLTSKYIDTILKIDKTIEKINLTQKVKKLISNENNI